MRLSILSLPVFAAVTLALAGCNQESNTPEKSMTAAYLSV